MGASPVAFLKRRLKLRSGMPDCLTACSIGLATEKWPVRHSWVLRIVCGSQHAPGPFPGPANPPVSMIGHGLENDIGRKTVGVSLKREELRHALRGGRTHVLSDDVENQIVP